ncbi:DUF1593 domain-containing protein [Pararhodonellum marinum]|uniref:DUF1593 domain-containing protein n=1 Tax=Pararhodonellum marinum TaxID=2755358 RepID=UPI001E5ED2D3|nr:DUF1593 domain-containing protein [Pararhodonellum marinum]
MLSKLPQYSLLLSTIILMISCQNPDQVRDKYRVVIMTDMTHDDGNSLIRMLYYPEVFDIEAVIITQQLPDYDFDANEPWDKAMGIYKAYEQELPQLRKHLPDFPSYEALMAVTKPGRGALVINFLQEGQRFDDYIGEGINPNAEPKDSEGSEFLIEVFEKEDDRPIYVQLWGGPVTFVQALYRFRQRNGDEKLQQLLQKVFVYGILLQDITADYFVDLFQIKESGCMGLGTYQPEEGFQGRRVQPGTFVYDGGHFWDYLKAVDYRTVNGHGPMSEIYDNGGEGDTPAFLYLISAFYGLNDPMDPTMGSWGGRFVPMDESYGANYYHTCGLEKSNLIRWVPQTSHDFWARLQWSIKDPEEVNYVPMACIDGNKSNEILYLKAKAGEKLTFDASCSTDPNGDDLSFQWSHYQDAGTFKGQLNLDETDQPNLTLVLPEDYQGEAIHLILEVKDNGEIPLVAYRRVVIGGI